MHMIYDRCTTDVAAHACTVVRSVWVWLPGTLAAVAVLNVCNGSSADMFLNCCDHVTWGYDHREHSGRS